MSSRMKRALAVAALLIALPCYAEETVDLPMMARIRDEGLQRSQAMETLYHLTHIIGPRLTGSPQLKAANQWTRDRFAGWGVANPHLEAYPFGRGWSFSSCQVRLVSPYTAVLTALPKAWIPGTNGPLRGQAMRVKIDSPKDLDAYRGKVAGKIVLLSGPRELKEPKEPEYQRLSQDDLAKLSGPEEPGEAPDWRADTRARWKLRQAINDFLVQEKALATFSIGSRNNDIVGATNGGSWQPGDKLGVPALVMASEPYNDILRMLDHGQTVEL
ncbi:MAG TPA: peptidase, partial [Thermoanaerobaculia bacterium]